MMTTRFAQLSTELPSKHPTIAARAHQVMEAVNARSRARRMPGTIVNAAPVPAPTPDPVTEFTAAVAAKRAAGLSPMNATAAVVAERPQLHRDYIDAVNDRQNRRLRGGR